jgi:tetratricopeptide (TPR) repeat protein
MPTLFALLLCAVLGAGEDPLEAPKALTDFAQAQTRSAVDANTKLSLIVRGFFAPADQGGLGMTYDNSYTRTVHEGFRDRKANCFTLTAMYIACCRSLGVEARYAESQRISHWRRVGGTTRYERHLVAMVPQGPLGQARVADFLPELSLGAHSLLPISPQRALAMFHSNRAVELMGSAREEALAEARASVEADPAYGGGWNVQGVVQRDQGLEREAEASFRQAMALDPTDGIPCGNLELLLQSQGREEEARVCAALALEGRKKNPFFHAFLAQEALDEGHWEEAERSVDQALKRLPRELEFLLLKARICLAQGREKAAIKALKQAQKWAIPEDQPRWNAKLAMIKGH